MALYREKKIKIQRILILGSIIFVALCILFASLYFTKNIDKANAFDSSNYELVNFNDTLALNVPFPYYSNPTYYMNHTHIIPDNNLTFNGYIDLQNGFGFNGGGSTSCLNKNKSIIVNNNTYNLDIITISPNSSWTLLYFWPTKNSNLKNTNKDYYLNFYLSGNFSNVALNTTINGITGTETTIINGSYNNGFSVHYTFGNNNNDTYLRVLIQSVNNTAFDIACCISDTSKVFFVDNVQSELSMNNTYAKVFNSYTGGTYAYTTTLPFNLGGNISVDNENYWSYDYARNFADNFSPIYNVTLFIDNTYIMFPMSVGQPEVGIADVNSVCYVGSFTYNNYKIFVNFFNCNYPTKDYIYNFRFDFFCNNNPSISLRNISVKLMNNVVNNSSYNNGYVKGYENGLIELNNQVSASYNNGYNNGYTTGLSLAQNGSFFGLISSAIESPLNAVLQMLDVEILGVNMRNFYMSLISVALVLFIIRICFKGSAKGE